jgi:acyl-CoA synthetase (AMP-forming)/AMP-acid ligase II
VSYANVARFLWDNVGPRPDVDALVTARVRFTHRELERAVDRWAQALCKAGIGRGDRVPIVALVDHRYVLAMLALAKLGAVAVPINTRWAVPEVSYALDLLEPKSLVADEALMDLAVEADRGAAIPVEVIALDDLESAADRVDEPPLPYADVSLEDPLRILFTSGTTSRPKGVVMTHGNSAWNHYATAVDLGVGADDRVLVCYPMFHIAGLESAGVFSTLAVGGTVVLAERPVAVEVAELVRDELVTGAVLLPPLYSDLLGDTSYHPHLESLRWVITGAVSPGSMDSFRARLPGRRLIEVFAMTEATGPATVLDEARMVEKAGRTGRAVTHVDVRVVGADGQPVPTGEPGVIELRGPKISLRYWGVEEDRPDGWFSTGDIGDLDDDGYLSYRGREKEMIKSGGENIAMAEVERVILQHSTVFAACIVRIPDARWGEAAKAFVQPTEGSVVDIAALRRFAGSTSPASRYLAPGRWSKTCRSTTPARCSDANSKPQRMPAQAL